MRRSSPLHWRKKLAVIQRQSYSVETNLAAIAKYNEYDENISQAAVIFSYQLAVSCDNF